MLKGIPHCISPDLLAALHRMGHGDEIVLADAHFPAYSMGPQVLRADGITIIQLLNGILPLWELDTYAPPLVMMDAVAGDGLDPNVEKSYLEVIGNYVSAKMTPQRIERFEFYRRAKSAFAIVLTGELRKYGNIILKKGLIATA